MGVRTNATSQGSLSRKHARGQPVRALPVPDRFGSRPAEHYPGLARPNGVFAFAQRGVFARPHLLGGGDLRTEAGWASRRRTPLAHPFEGGNTPQGRCLCS